MDCQKTTQKLHYYIDDLLQPVEKEQVKMHLSACPACQKELHLLKKTWDVLKDYPVVEPSSAYVSNFYTRLTQEPASKPFVLEWLLKPQLFKGLFPVAVGLSLLLVGYFSWKTIEIKSIPTEQAMASFSKEELEIIDNYDLAENYDVIADLELLENLDVIEQLEPQAS